MGVSTMDKLMKDLDKQLEIMRANTERLKEECKYTDGLFEQAMKDCDKTDKLFKESRKARGKVIKLKRRRKES